MSIDQGWLFVVRAPDKNCKVGELKKREVLEPRIIGNFTVSKIKCNRNVTWVVFFFISKLIFQFERSSVVKCYRAFLGQLRMNS